MDVAVAIDVAIESSGIADSAANVDFSALVVLRASKFPATGETVVEISPGDV